MLPVARIVSPSSNPVSLAVGPTAAISGSRGPLHTDDVIDNRYRVVSLDVEQFYPSLDLMHARVVLRRAVTIYFSCHPCPSTKWRACVEFSMECIEFMLSVQYVSFGEYLAAALTIFMQIQGITIRMPAAGHLSNMILNGLDEIVVTHFGAHLASYSRFIDDV